LDEIRDLSYHLPFSFIPGSYSALNSKFTRSLPLRATEHTTQHESESLSAFPPALLASKLELGIGPFLLTTRTHLQLNYLHISSSWVAFCVWPKVEPIISHSALRPKSMGRGNSSLDLNQDQETRTRTRGPGVLLCSGQVRSQASAAGFR
jgi:hypothetical protein